MRWSKSPWWRYHQCHCRRRQQCLIKLYNLERLKWSPMRSDLKSRTLPLAVAVLCVRILSDFLPIKLQLLLFFGWASLGRVCMRMKGQNLLRWANNGSGLPGQVYWNASASCQCSDISTMEYDGYQLAWVWVVLMSETPSCQWAYQWRDDFCWETRSHLYHNVSVW